MSKVRGQAPTQRQRRINEEIRHALAHVFERGELRDPLLASTAITITEVRCNPDLRNATAFFTPLGGIGDAQALRAALIRVQPFLRHEIARRVEMKYVPRLSFEIDTSFDEYAYIANLLKRPDVVRDTESMRHADDEDQGEES